MSLATRRVRRTRVARRVTRVTLVVALVLSAAACSASDSSSTRTSATPTRATDDGTTLEELDTGSLVVRRAPFCDAVDPAAVERALGEEPADASAYRSGQRIEMGDDVADVVHEFGCRWTAGQDIAEAWVFAPPVTPERARQLADQPRCEGRAPGFGRPSSTCESGDGGARTTRHQGLFGDAWLTCSLTLSGEPATEVGDRASQWCAAVATGAATTR